MRNEYGTEPDTSRSDTGSSSDDSAGRVGGAGTDPGGEIPERRGAADGPDALDVDIDPDEPS